MNGELEKCRWCGRITTLTYCGRCDMCQAHYQRYKVRVAKHGKFISLGLLLLIALTSANSCFFDTNLGRLSCLSGQNTTIDRAVQMANSFRAQGIDPAWMKQKYDAYMAKQAGNSTIPYRLATVSQNLTNSPPALLNVSVVNQTDMGGSRQNRTQPACQNDLEKDWQAYCRSNFPSACYCYGCEANPNVHSKWKAEKESIMRNMEQIRGCVYN